MGKTLNNSWFTPNVCFLISKNFLEQNKLSFPERLTVGEDSIFNVDFFMCNGKVLEISDVFFNYRINQNRVMSKCISSKRLSSHYKCIELINSKKVKTENEYIRYLLDATAALLVLYSSCSKTEN